MVCGAGDGRRRRPLRGKLYAVQTGGLPGLSIVLPPPAALELDGVTTVAPSGELVESFTRIPDLPVSALTVTIASTGMNSLLSAGTTLCAGSASIVSATFTPQDGAGPIVSSLPVTPLNCPGPAARLRPSRGARLSFHHSQVVHLSKRRSGDRPRHVQGCDVRGRTAPHGERRQADGARQTCSDEACARDGRKRRLPARRRQWPSREDHGPAHQVGCEAARPAPPAVGDHSDCALRRAGRPRSGDPQARASGEALTGLA